MIQKYLFDTTENEILLFVNGCGVATYPDGILVAYGINDGTGHGNGFGDSLKNENLFKGITENK